MLQYLLLTFSLGLMSSVQAGNIVESIEWKLKSVLPGLINMKGLDLETKGFNVKGLIPSHLEQLLYFIEENPSVKDDLLRNVSENCGSHIQAWAHALQNNVTLESNTWALQMIDAWPKLPEGILTGHTTVLGSFDECLEIRANPVEGSFFKGKYCSVHITPDLARFNATTPFRSNARGAVSLDEFLATQLFSISGTTIVPMMGSCYPSSCSNEDVGLMLTNAFNMIPGLGKFMHPTVTYCTTDDVPTLTSGDIGMLTILSIIGVLCLAGTAVDLAIGEINSSKAGYGVQALLAFSLNTNIKKLMSTGKGGVDNFGCIHGIRFLSTCWVVLGHTWVMISFQNTTNMVDIKRINNGHWTLYAILNGTISVDTFFTISALLFSFNMLKVLQKSKGVINLPMMYLHRYLRLTPTYGLIVGIIATIFKYARDGPGWYAVTAKVENCRRDWWKNVLYMNNLIEYDGPIVSKMCLPESWYMSNDMQFFLISPLFIYPLFKWERLGMAFLVLVSIASIATPWIIHVQKGLIPTFLISRVLETEPFIAASYVKPWTRFGPYAVGLWTGFVLYKTSGKCMRLPKWAVLLGWLGSTATAIGIIFGIIPWFDPATEIPDVLNGFYAGSHRFGWGIVISWIIFACTKGYGGPVNDFLSWKAFVPLGRLTFCAYLIHSMVLATFQAGLRQTIHYDVYTYTNFFFAQLVMTLLLGFVCCITMESPFIALEKLLFQGPPNAKLVKDLHELEDKETNIKKEAFKSV